MAETWRVVLATGEVREVRVVLGDGQPPWTAEAPALFGTSRGVTPWVAVARLALRWVTRPREILAPGEPTRAELLAQLAAVATERNVLRAQQAPLLDAHDALVAAARAAGWTGAGATGAELVAWVRRGALLDAARIAMERGGEWVASEIRLAAMDLMGGE